MASSIWTKAFQNRMIHTASTVLVTVTDILHHDSANNVYVKYMLN